MARNCPCCGQPVVDGDITLPRLKRRIFDFVRRRPGCSAEEIARFLYADDPNGGPGEKTIHVHVHHLNKLLLAHGLKVYGRRSGYRLTRAA